jgi:hypothetical protein
MVSIFSCVFWPFGLLPLKMFCLVQLSTSLLVHYFLGSLVFWAPCIFWLSVLWCIASKYFLPLSGWSLQFKDHFFCCAEAFYFTKSHLTILSLNCWAAEVLLRKSLPIPIVSRVFSALSCTNCKVLDLILRSLIHFELMLVQGDKQGSSFSFLQADNHFFQQHLLKRLSFLHHMFLAPSSKIRWS